MKVILLAEDDENDILLVQRAFKEVHILNPLQVVRDAHSNESGHLFQFKPDTVPVLSDSCRSEATL